MKGKIEEVPFDIGKCIGCEYLAPDESGRGVCWHLSGDLPERCQLNPDHPETRALKMEAING